MLSHHKKDKFQTHSSYVRTTVKAIAFLLFVSYSYTLPGKHCNWLGSKSKDCYTGKFIYLLLKQQTVVALFIGQEGDVLQEEKPAYTANYENWLTFM